MKKNGTAKEEQERLMEEFERDVAKLTNKMDADRMRMQNELEVSDRSQVKISCGILQRYAAVHTSLVPLCSQSCFWIYVNISSCQ